MKYVLGGPSRFDHQKRGLRGIIENRGVAALLFDPGLGKSATVIDYMGLLALKAPSREARVLVICPLGAVDTWVSQTRQFLSPQVGYWSEAVGGTIKQRVDTLTARGPEKDRRRKRLAPRARHTKQRSRALNYDLAREIDVRDTTRQPLSPLAGPDGLPGPRVVMEVLNLDTLASRRQHGSKTMADVVLSGVLAFQPDLVVLDESHLIKGVSSNSSKLMARIGSRVPRRVVLTGTVMPHSPLDVWAQWRFLDPYAFGRKDRNGRRLEATYTDFQNRYAEFGGWMGREAVGFRNLDHLQKIMEERAIVARKEDSLDLPPTTDVEVDVHLSPAESKAYIEMKKQLATSLSSGALMTAPSRLAQMLRLRQITAGHLPDDAGVVHEIGRSKVSTARSLVNETLAGEKRVVVFAMFRHEIEVLSEVLREKGTEVLTITGDTSPQDRTDMRRRFGSEEPTRLVMVAQIKTMSLAVNELVTASHAVFVSLSQRRDEYVQARDRLNRVGQTRPVTFWHVMVPGTVDAAVLRAHRQRTDLESAVLAHILDGDFTG